MITDQTNPLPDTSSIAAADTYVHARIDTPTKERANSALRAMGLTVSDAIRLLMLYLASERSLPSGMKAPGSAAAEPQTVLGSL